MRTDQEQIRVAVDGNDIGIFDSFKGGATDSVELRHRPGGMVPEEALGGPQTITNFTVERLYKLERDHQIYIDLQSRVGIGQVTAVRQKLNPDRSAFGAPTTYTGVLKMVAPPDTDSDSPAKAMLSLEVTPDGAVS